MLSFNMFYFINRHIILSLLLGGVWILLWGLLAAKADIAQKRTLWKVINTVVLILSLGLILYITIISRSTSSRECIFIPFNFLLKDAHTHSDIASAIMNLLLFIPVGLSLPYLFKKSARQKVIITLIFAACLSAAIELSQYIWSFGILEIDDVIMNTFGAILGALSYKICVLALRIYSKNKADKK